MGLPDLVMTLLWLGLLIWAYEAGYRRGRVDENRSQSIEKE